jgi:hypothetical protein
MYALIHWGCFESPFYFCIKKKQIFTSLELLLLLPLPSSLLARRRRLTLPTDSVFIHHPSAVSSSFVIASLRHPFLCATPIRHFLSDIYVTTQKLASCFLLFESVTNFLTLYRVRINYRWISLRHNFSRKCHKIVKFMSFTYSERNIFNGPKSMGNAVAQWLRHCATKRKVAGSIPDGVIGIFHWHNHSGRTMVLGSTQHLTEIGIRNISWG